MPYFLFLMRYSYEQNIRQESRPVLIIIFIVNIVKNQVRYLTLSSDGTYLVGRGKVALLLESLKYIR